MILITGASKGIGKYLLQKYISTGMAVFGTYNNSPPDEVVASHLRKVNINNPDQISDWLSEAMDLGDPKVLINCAGINYNSFAHKSELDKWESVIQTNLIGTFKVIRQVLPIMRKQKYGRIINFSSIVAETGIPGTSAYAASKSGLWGMTRAISMEAALHGVTINNLNLGYFNIGMIEEVPVEYQRVIKDKLPTKEFGDPENIWKSVNYIIESDYLNGTSIDLNGGLY